MAEDVYVHHPVFVDEVHLVAAADVDDWKASGWVRVKRTEQATVVDKVPLTEQATEEK